MKFLDVVRVTKDPIKYGENTVVLNVVKSYKGKGNEKEPSYFGILFFGKTGEAVLKYCHKGKMVYVEGICKTKSEKVNERYYTVPTFIGNRVEFISSDKPPHEEAQPTPGEPQSWNEEEPPF